MSKQTSSRKRKTVYEKVISMNDGKINVLVLGTSGCGKSTLINSVLEANEAKTGVGEAATKTISIYQNEKLPFRMIDTVGYEYGLFSQLKIKNDILKLSKEGVKDKDVEKLIHMIWFCVDGTSKRISQEVLGYIKSVTSDWKNVPIIFVLTKSYSKIEIDENVKMAEEAISKYNEKHKRKPLNIKEIIPVVAKTYYIDDTFSAPQMGLDVLVNKTIELVPEARSLSNESIKEIDLKIKNSMCKTITAVSTTAATAVGAIPFTIPDATLLVPIQTTMLNRISKVYDINDKESSDKLVKTIIKIGTTTMVGKALVKTLKTIPVLNAVGSLLEATIAGAVTMAAGSIANTVLRKAYTNEIELKSLNLDEEITKMFKDYLPGVLDAIKEILGNNKGMLDIKTIGELLASIATKFKVEEEK